MFVTYVTTPLLTNRSVTPSPRPAYRTWWYAPAEAALWRIVGIRLPPSSYHCSTASCSRARPYKHHLIRPCPRYQACTCALEQRDVAVLSIHLRNPIAAAHPTQVRGSFRSFTEYALLPTVPGAHDEVLFKPVGAASGAQPSSEPTWMPEEELVSDLTVPRCPT